MDETFIDDVFDEESYVATTKEGFLVDTVDKVEWVLLKLAQYDSAVDTLKERTKRIVAAIQSEKERFKTRFMPQVEEFAKVNRETLFKGKTLNLAAGKLQYRTPTTVHYSVEVSPDTPVDVVPPTMRKYTVTVKDHKALATLIANNPALAEYFNVDESVDVKALETAALAKLEAKAITPSLQRLIDDGHIKVTELKERLIISPAEL